ncbi:lipopolysaccharide biosynthesis protein [Serratia fonticola]|uniref:lipopolysaccharide biosynthesis protein n=1 Tax=Serratia fonticola TaxID=47917 RepID=UPI001415499B|nr:lipopolysaccharide biosynthesis protein [Serratia fonticola]NXZ86155.1 lipopolysaccharide biosynthesis protein [Serratia fonticola]QIP93622.1 polysaccharide biosynthesis protein [Serratia fonticola]
MGLVSNVKWVSLSQIVKVTCQLVGMVIFSRYLTPKEIGIMSMATIVVNFVNIIRDMGASAAIIQKEYVSEVLKRSVFTLNLIFGITILVVMLTASRSISLFFDEKQLTFVICLIAFAFPITSSTSIHLSLLERESKFFKTAKVEVISSVLSLVGGIIAAVNNFGVYSLVIQTLLYAVLSSIGFWFCSSWKTRIGWSTCEIKAIFKFSSNLVGFNFINYFSRNLDQIIVGRFFGSAMLGIYSLAYKVMLFPLQNITSVLTRSLYPILSRLQNDKEQGGKIYLNTLRFISIVIPPLMLGLSSVRDDFVSVIFGPKWIDMAHILFWLAPTAILQSIISTTGSVFMSGGRTDLLLKISIFNALLQICAFMIGAAFNLDVLVKLYFIANLIMFFPNLGLALSILNTSLGTAVLYIYKPIACSVAMFFMVTYCIDKIKLIGFSADTRLLCSILIGIVSYSILLFLIDGKSMFMKLRTFKNNK